MSIYSKFLEMLSTRDESHFAKKAANKILSRFPGRDRYILESGFTPSGKVHLGNFGDILITEAVRRVLEAWGKDAESILVIDSKDPFRKPPVFLPDKFKSEADRWLGRPLCNIPDPWGCHDSYAEHFVAPLVESLEKYGLRPRIVRAEEIHILDSYVAALRRVILDRDKIRRILNRVHEAAGHRKRYGEQWIPYRPICGGCGRIDEKVIPKAVHDDGCVVEYVCSVCGYEGEADIRKGEGKPPWRIDWPLRWVIFDVHFEPMGKDLMAAGSSYHTGRALLLEYFGRQPPVAVFYDFFYWIEPGKEPRKFSKRLGVGLGAHEWLRYAPPEVLNYMILRRSVGDIERESLRHIDFCIYDIPTYVGRFDQDEKKLMEALLSNNLSSDDVRMAIAYFLSLIDPERALRRPIRRVPYDAAMRVALWMIDVDDGLAILRRMGALPPDASDDEIRDAITRIRCAQNFIRDCWRPPRIDAKKILPELRVEEISALRYVLRSLLSIPPTNVNQRTVGNVVKDASRRYGVRPRRIYEIMYLAATGEKSGPQACRLFWKEFSRRNLERFLGALQNAG